MRACVGVQNGACGGSQEGFDAAGSCEAGPTGVLDILLCPARHRRFTGAGNRLAGLVPEVPRACLHHWRTIRSQQHRAAVLAIVARDAEVLHALRDAKDMSRGGVAAVGLTAEELAQLPELLRNAQAVLLDARDNTLLFIGRASDRRESAKVVVRVNFRLKLSDGKSVTNAFKTATLADLDSIKGQAKRDGLILLRGKL